MNKYGNTLEQSSSERQVRLNGRDWHVLSFLGQVRLIQSDDLNLVLGRGRLLAPRSVRAVIARWDRRGLVQRHYLAPGPPAVTLTAHGRYSLGLPTTHPVGLPSWTQIPHTLATASVAARYMTGFVESGVWSDPSNFSYTHTPDGVVETTDSFIAVEVELNRKSEERWRSILSDLANEWDKVHYWTNEDVGKALMRVASESLNEEQLNKFRFFNLGGEQL